MFVLATVERASFKSKDLDVAAHCCLFMFNVGVVAGIQVAYNALGYALLNSNALFTPGLSMTDMVQSGAIGAGVGAGIGCVIFNCSKCCGTQDDEDSCIDSAECSFLSGPCNDVLNSVINSLIGAGIKGLFVNNVTTPAFVAASSAAGAATIAGGLFAVTVIVGGVTYFIGQLSEMTRDENNTRPAANPDPTRFVDVTTIPTAVAIDRFGNPLPEGTFAASAPLEPETMGPKVSRLVVI